MIILDPKLKLRKLSAALFIGICIFYNLITNAYQNTVTLLLLAFKIFNQSKTHENFENIES